MIDPKKQFKLSRKRPAMSDVNKISNNNRFLPIILSVPRTNQMLLKKKFAKSM